MKGGYFSDHFLLFGAKFQFGSDDATDRQFTCLQRERGNLPFYPLPLGKRGIREEGRMNSFLILIHAHDVAEVLVVKEEAIRDNSRKIRTRYPQTNNFQIF